MFHMPAEDFPGDGPDAWGAVTVGWNGNHNVLVMWGFDFAPMVEEFECWPALLKTMCAEIEEDFEEAYATLLHAIEVQNWVARGFDEGHVDAWPEGECPSIEAVRAAMLAKHTRNIKRRTTATRRAEFGRSRPALVLAMIDAGHAYECAVSSCSEVANLTVDHIVPLSRGGTDDTSNLQFMCRSHNSAKGDRRDWCEDQ